MNDQQLLRYARHVLLEEIGVQGQEKIMASSVAVIGCGGLGSTVLPYLAASGVGKIIIADDDVIDLSNLQRQVLYGEKDTGSLKVQVACAVLQEKYPACIIETIAEKIHQENLLPIIQSVDVVVDCTDNFPTRQTINRISKIAGKPLVFGAVSQFAGQITVFDFRQPESPCYACIFPDTPQDDATCAASGVFAPLVGVIGTMQAAETLKIILGLSTLHGKMQCFNAINNRWQTMTLTQNSACPVCHNAR